MLIAMYGKIFTSMYDGTLADDWQALITFQQLIVLADADGHIDMTPMAISRRTGIPINHIESGLICLSNEDKYSRTPAEKGKRILLIDDHKPWGWIIVNYEKYKHISNSDDAREQTRLRVAKHRRIKKDKEIEENKTKDNKGLGSCNVTKALPVTSGTECNDIYIKDIDINTDKEIEENKDLKIEKKKKPEYPDNLNLEAWELWKQHKKEKKQTYKQTGEKVAIKKLCVLDHDSQLLCIEDAVAKNYTGFFPENFTGSNNGQFQNTKPNNKPETSGERANREYNEAFGLVPQNNGQTLEINGTEVQNKLAIIDGELF